MAIYQVIIRKRFGDSAVSSEHWSNVYYLDEPSIASLETDILTVVDAEMAVSKDAVNAFAYSYHLNGGVGGWTTKNISVDGQIIPVDVTGRLPSWNVARVNLLPPTGRPSIKYLRLPLYEEDVLGVNLTNGMVTDLLLNYANVLVGFGYVTDEDGTPLTDATVQTAIQMRQPSWSRRFRVGFKRGWVAV